MSDDWWKSDPVAQPAARTGYIPGVPKPQDPLDVQAKQLGIQKSQLDIAKAEKEAATTGGGTGEQGTAAGFYQRALFANQKYGDGLPPRSPLVQGVVDHLPTSLVNSMTGEKRQEAEAYARDFVAATLRKESGAAISPEEYQNQYIRYFPQPGDAQGTIAAKAQLRQTAIQSLRNQAGPAADAADKTVSQMVQSDKPQGDIGFATPEQPKNPLTTEQQHAYDAWLAANPKATKDQFASFMHSINAPVPVNADNILDALHKGNGFQSGSTATTQQDPRVTAEIQRRLQNRSGGGNAALVGAATDIPLINHLTAAVDAGAHSLVDPKSSFGDNYGVALDSVLGYENALRSQNPMSYLGGQLGGAVLLPAGEATSATDLAKVGAAYGAAQGADQSNSQAGLTGTLGNALLGGASGAATGYGIGKVALRRGTGGAVPDLIDQSTGALNQPLEAMSPGQRVQAANQFGIDLPMDAAGGRSAAIVGKGLDIMPGSAGVMEDARRATEGQVAAAADKVASNFGSARTLNEAGSELQAGAQQRIDRGKAVISKAYNAIPIADATPASTSSTVATLQQLTGRLQSNADLANAMRDPTLSRYLDAIQKDGLSWKDLKDFRSIIGEKIGDYRFGEGHSTQDLRALYAGLSEDMRNTAASMGPQASRAFERANSLNRNNEQLVQGALTRILGKDGNLAPEKAAAVVQAMTKGGKSTGDLKTLAQIRSATMKSGAWDEVASTLIRLGGQPANSAGRDFNPQTFVNWYADMAQPARNLLFGQGELRKSLDQFVAVNQRLMKVNALRNTSNTTPNMIGAGLVGGAGMAAVSHPSLLLGMGAEMGANYGMAKAWTNPAFVRWATGFARAQSPGAARSQIGRLGKIAATNPELRQPLVALQQHLLSAVNDNFTPAVASQPDQSQQNVSSR